MFSKRVAVVGAGLIGGSLGLALRAARPEVEVVGYDIDLSAARAGIQRGAFHRLAGSPAAAVAGADVVVLAVPVDRIPDGLRDIAGAVEPGAVVTDVGSAKRAVVETGEELFPGRFVGGHPMAGSERGGMGGADGDLFEDAWWIVTPTPATVPAAYKEVVELVDAVGARAIAIDPETHDALVARLSHLPQLTASALVDVAVAGGDRDTLLGLAGAGFRDVTRIAASDPDLWVAIVRSNRDAVLESLAGLGRRLSGVSDMVAGSRWDDLRDFLEGSQRARTGLFAKQRFEGPPEMLSLPVPDRPGVLAEVTTAAGALGANIEDLRIVHSTEGGRGRLELVVAASAADALAAALDALGYRVERHDPR